MAHPSILIVGAKGRMGLAIRDTAIRLGFPIAGAVDAGDDPMQFIARADVVIDFSHHTATADVIAMVAAAGKALVIGTTGHSAAEREALATQAAKIPCVWAGNFSVGVNLLNHLVREAARALDSSFDIEVVEMHHRMKKDAPSGTAGTLLRILEESRGLTANNEKHGRSGITGERTSTEIGVHALRGGDVVGDHTVVFAGAGERLELTHKASSREIFALGALRATGWLSGRSPGLYDMSHVLGIGESGRQP
jgi:4-hydroxy-tetrahydrodipicolinate reductase